MDAGSPEDFILQVAPALEGEFVFAVPLDWRSPVEKPCNVVSWGAVETEALMTLLEPRKTLLIVSTFEKESEEAGTSELLGLLQTNDEVVVVIVQIVPPAVADLSSSREVLLKRFERLLTCGANGVLLDPDFDPEAVRRDVEHERLTFDMTAERVRLSIDKEGWDEIHEQHHRLLWQDLPKALMPSFPQMDVRLKETTRSVSNYQLLHKYATRSDKAKFLVARKIGDESGDLFVIKVKDKQDNIMPEDVESIYREYRFMSDVLKHPNIGVCVEMIHSETRLYSIFEFAGAHNFAQLLQGQPGYRVEADEALEAFLQVADALAHCHLHNISHRMVCLEHIVYSDDGDSMQCRLVDFTSACSFPNGMMSSLCCGRLPCVAPEMAMLQKHVPSLSDCWSLGVVLLESAGGLGSLRRCAGLEEDVELDLADAGARLLQYFQEPGSPTRALACAGGVDDERVRATVEALLKTVPSERANLSDLLSYPMM